MSEISRLNGYDIKDLKGVRVYNNVESMQNDDTLKDGQHVKTKGFYSDGDGGSALYKIRTVTNDDVIDNLSIIEINNTELIAEIVIEDTLINVLKYGLKNDGLTDNYLQLNALLSTGVTNLYFPSGTYILSEEITIPNTCKTILGENNANTTILCSESGFNLENISYTVIKNITLKNVNENKTYNGISGQIKSSLFENVRIQYFSHGLNISGGSWVNTFFKCILEFCEYGLYKDNDGDFNDNEFLRCNISANDYGVYIIASNQNITFNGCDIENNTKVIMSGGYTNNMNIQNCYCEGNKNIYSIISGFNDNSIVNIEKCRIYQPSATDNGWIAIARTMRNDISGKTSSINLKDNTIFYRNTDYKPLSFDDTVTDNPNSLIVFNVFQNFYGGTAGNNYPQTYFDLIDRTNFPNYCKTGQRRSFHTDLTYNIIENNLYCNMNNAGVSNGVGRTLNRLHFFGYVAFEQTGQSQKIISIPNECGVYAGYNKRFSGVMHYSDNSIGIVDVGIDANTISLYNIDSSKTTSFVSLDFTCRGSGS